MNKKDYEAIAKIIKKERNYIDKDNQPIEKIAYALHANRYLSLKLADYFEKVHGTTGGGIFEVKIFDKKQFLKACGVE